VDKDGIDLMRTLPRTASSTGKLPYGSFLASVHWEVSVVLCKGNHAIFRARLQFCARVSRHARVPGPLIPSADIDCCWVSAPGCLSLPWCSCI
jgi:hypothetical protein